jgi:hypothetical protein
VRQRLLNIAASKGEDFGLVLTRHALERLLYRLSRSPYRDRFILKGAMLFQAWTRLGLPIFSGENRPKAPGEFGSDCLCEGLLTPSSSAARLPR